MSFTALHRYARYIKMSLLHYNVFSIFFKIYLQILTSVKHEFIPILIIFEVVAVGSIVLVVVAEKQPKWPITPRN